MQVNKHISHHHVEKTLTVICSISQAGSIGIKQMNKIPLRRSSRAQIDNVTYELIWRRNETFLRKYTQYL